jgi:hypothetical protein
LDGFSIENAQDLDSYWCYTTQSEVKHSDEDTCLTIVVEEILHCVDKERICHCKPNEDGLYLGCVNFEPI